jgi:hypothetical protein
MISIICYEERELVARFQGHGSWINSVAFDPWRCDGRNYRFGSVADDRRLLLWDFNASMLQRPRAVSSTLSLFLLFSTLCMARGGGKDFTTVLGRVVQHFLVA